MAAMTNDELAEWIEAEIQQSKVKTATWRKDARECYAFYSSKQWSDEDETLLEQAGRPAVVFNRVARTVNAIAGLEVQNRQEVRYLPREQTDGRVNELLTLATKWVRDNCDAEDEESEAFQDTLISGMGWTDTSLEYEKDPDGMIIVERDDALSYFWDSKAKKRNLDDRKWCGKVTKMSRKDCKDRWKWEGTNTDGSLLDDEDEPHDASPPFYDGKSEQGSVRKDVEVLCFQWYDLEEFYRCQLSDGRIIELSVAKYAKLKDSLVTMGVKCIKQRRRKYKKAYKIGKEIVEVLDSESQVGFTYNCITGLRDRNNNTWFGIVSLMIDPQRWANKWLSQIMHILNSNSKGGLLAENGAFADSRKAEKEWADPQAITWLNEGGLGKIEQKQISQMPSGIEGLLKYALESINDVPGVNTELLGLADRQQAGVLENSRKQAGVTMLAIFFDSLRRYRKEQGRIMAKMIVEYIADGRLIRIVGEDGAQVIPLLKDPLLFEYDVVVDDAPTSPNQKEKTFAVLMQLLPPIMQAGVPVPPELIDYLPLPEALLQKWKEMVKPDPAKEQQKQQAAKQQAMEAMQMEAQAEAMKEQAKGQVAIEVENTRAQAQLIAKRGEAQLELQKEQGKAAIAVQIEDMKAQNAAELQQLKDQNNLILEQARQDFEQWKVETVENNKIVLQQMNNDHQIRQTSVNANISKMDESTEMDDAGQPKPSVALKSLVEAINTNNKSLVDGIVGAQTESNKLLLETLSRPKKIVRDAGGRALGVE
jgi:hypothetical protein